MLVVTRRAGEGIVIGKDVHITVIWTKGGKVRFGISAPRSVEVRRAELPVNRSPSADLSETAEIER
jgi:carbon storage regulator